MSYSYHGYIPKQGDLVWINFDPGDGREIQKRRPAIVLSIVEFNSTTGFVALCPITSTKRDGYIKVESKNEKIKGFIDPGQIRSVDYIQSKRRIEYVDQATLKVIGLVGRRVFDMLGFDELFEM